MLWKANGDVLEVGGGTGELKKKTVPLPLF
jgi:hypothetical protein